MKENCTTCDGTGYDDGTGKKCSTCGGTGSGKGDE